MDSEIAASSLHPPPRLDDLPAASRADALARRVFDGAAATLGLLGLSPLLAAIAVVIKLSDGGPVFYRSRRVGRHAQAFRLYKFRTMVPGAERQGPGITTAGDARVTRVGAWLRRTKLDELPQLWNVLRGEMSLVGPRPEDPRFVAHYTPEQRQVLTVRPGLTSPASLAYRHEEHLLDGPDWRARYLEEILPHKLALEREYLRQRTLWSDLGVIGRTLVALFRPPR